MIVWLNGRFVESDGAISAEDRGFLLGEGAFETIYTEGGRCAFLNQHNDRLRCGLQTLGLAGEAADKDWREISAGLARANGVGGAAALRITVTPGPGGRGLGAAAGPPTVLASMSRLSGFPEGCKLKLARARRYSGALGARCKLVGGYVDNLAALAEARAAGADEAIMLNERGDVACASAANIFLISPAGVAATPRLSDGALPGVVRSILIAGAHDVRIEERSVRVEELSAALVLLTNSLRGVALCAGAGATPGQARAAAALKSCYAEALAAELGREKP